MIKTKNRIILRKFNKKDSTSMFKWAKNHFLIRYIGASTANSPEAEYRRLIDKIKNQGRIIFMIETQKRKPIGYIYIDVDKKNKKAEFSIAIGEKDCRSKGYGTESTKMALDYTFGRLKLNRIFLKVLTFNLSAINFYEKIGFKKEGVLRQDIYLNGKYVDFIVMSMLKKEYENNKNKKQIYR